MISNSCRLDFEIFTSLNQWIEDWGSNNKFIVLECLKKPQSISTSDYPIYKYWNSIANDELVDLDFTSLLVSWSMFKQRVIGKDNPSSYANLESLLLLENNVQTSKITMMKKKPCTWDLGIYLVEIVTHPTVIEGYTWITKPTATLEIEDTLEAELQQY